MFEPTSCPQLVMLLQEVVAALGHEAYRGVGERARRLSLSTNSCPVFCLLICLDGNEQPHVPASVHRNWTQRMLFLPW